MSEESGEQSARRRAKLAELRARGQAYPNDTAAVLDGDLDRFIEASLKAGV